MLKRLLILMTAVLLSASPCPAQQQDGPEIPPGRWWRIPAVTARIGLTPDEISRLDLAFNETSRKLIRLKGEVEAEQFELRTIVERPDLDTEAAMEQNRKLEAARGKLAEERFRFFLTIREIVGYDRFTQLLMMKRERASRIR